MPNYEIPLVSSNLRPEEMIIQMADTIDFLDQISDHIFKNVSRRIEESRVRIESINKRADAAQAKIEKLTGSRKATRIFSSSRFPGIFSAEYKSCLEEDGLTFKRTKLNGVPPFASLDADQFYLPIQRNNHNIKGKEQLQTKSASELLIFNSEDIAMLDQIPTEKLASKTTKRKNEVEATEDTGLGDAPWSIIQREQLERGQHLDYSYIPGTTNTKI